MKTSLYSSLLALALLAPNRVHAAVATDGGFDAAGEAGAPAAHTADAGANDASDTASNEVPLRCDGGLCDTTTGATACNVAEGRSHGGAAWPASVVLALAVTRMGRRWRNSRRKMP